MIDVAMYLRKSRAEELTDTVDETLKRHRETLTEFAHKNDLVIRTIYEEVVSGESLYARPQMLKLLADVEQGKYDAVLCMDIDRLGRGAMSDQGVILETLKSADTKIITLRKVYDLNNDIDETYSEFETFMARQELKAIKRRMQRGIKRTIQDGGYVANAPYGYTRQYTEDKRPTLKIVPEEAEFVRLIYDLYANKGYGCQRIADAINAMGAKPHRTDRFVRVSIMKILKNPTYNGKIVWNQKSMIRKGQMGNKKIKTIYNSRDKWIIVNGLHQPIISDNLYNRVQEIISTHTHPPANTGKVENPLAGLVYCGNCGALMQRQVIRRGGAYLMCQRRGCIVSSSLPLVEESVVNTLKTRLHELSLKSESAPVQKQKGNLEALSLIESEQKTLKTQLDKLHDLLEQGVYTIETFINRQNILNDKLQKLNKAKDNLKQIDIPDLKAEYSAVENVLNLYDAADSQGRNELLKNVIEKIIYDKKKGAKPGEFHLKFYFRRFYL